MQTISTAPGGVAVLFDEGLGQSAVEEWLTGFTNTKYTLFPVSSASTLIRALRQIEAGSPHKYSGVLNWCCGPEAEGYSAAHAAAFLARTHIPYSGCHADTLAYPLDTLFMMARYAEVPMPKYAVISNATADHSRQLRVLNAPVMVQSASPMLGAFRARVGSQRDVEPVVRAALEDNGSLVVWEVGQSTSAEVDVLITQDATYAFSTTLTPQELDRTDALWQNLGTHFVEQVLYHRGVALLSFVRSREGTGWQLMDLQLNPTSQRLSQLLGTTTCPPHLAVAWLTQLRALDQRPNFEVKLHEDSRKGYHLCASRAIAQGEIVFEDERRSFSIVTKPYVEEHWTPALKTTFSEYAWPLDGGHVYAIWENDPLRWRPINHSCDPNCIFSAPHSLNVIARRPIAAGEDLSMDYATFCDDVMKPFDCLCGAATCRKRVFADANVCLQYGLNSWIRPSPQASSNS